MKELIERIDVYLSSPYKDADYDAAFILDIRDELNKTLDHLKEIIPKHNIATTQKMKKYDQLRKWLYEGD